MMVHMMAHKFDLISNREFRMKPIRVVIQLGLSYTWNVDLDLSISIQQYSVQSKIYSQ